MLPDGAEPKPGAAAGTLEAPVPALAGLPFCRAVSGRQDTDFKKESEALLGPGYYSGREKAMYESPLLVPLLPPPHAITTNWRPPTA